VDLDGVEVSYEIWHSNFWIVGQLYQFLGIYVVLYLLYTMEQRLLVREGLIGKLELIGFGTAPDLHAISPDWP